MRQVDEFANALVDKLGFKGEPALLHSIFHQIDVDGTGKLGFDELTAWLNGRLTVAAEGQHLAKQLTFKGGLGLGDAVGGADGAASKFGALKKAAVLVHFNSRAPRGTSIGTAIAVQLAEERARARDEHAQNGGATPAIGPPWDVERLRLLIFEAVRASGAKIIDVLEAWDESGDVRPAPAHIACCNTQAVVWSTAARARPRPPHPDGLRFHGRDGLRFHGHAHVREISP